MHDRNAACLFAWFFFWYSCSHEEDKETKPEADKGETAEADDAKSAAVASGGVDTDNAFGLSRVKQYIATNGIRTNIDKFFKSERLQTLLDLFLLLGVINRLLPKNK